MKQRLYSILSLGILCGLWQGAAYGTKPTYAQLSEQFIADYFKDNPSEATYLGIHAYDDQLEDYSRAAITQDNLRTRQYLAAFEALPEDELTDLEKADREILIHHLRAQLLNTETVRYWETNPDLYSSALSSSVFTLMSRNFAPAEQRLKAVIAREKQMPSVLVAAKQNLKNPPPLFTRLALEQLPGNIDFFAKDVPLAFKEVTDESLKKEFNHVNQALIQALQQYETWLQKDLKPRSKGDYRIGREVFRSKLLYEEMVDTPLTRLSEIGYADLQRNQAQFKQVAQQFAPGKTPAAVLAMLNQDYPPPDKLLSRFQSELAGIKAFIEQKHILTIPQSAIPQVVETPPFMRALTFASMDTPGPFETQPMAAFFNVTLPEKDWSPADVADYMSGFNHGTLISTAIHETYPGHYVQFLWAPQARSKVRKIFGASSNSEGWAHYCEQMMLDEGYGEGDLRLRLGQLQDALLRNARYIVGIELHLGIKTFEESVDFFVKEGYQTKLNAVREVERGATEPTYLYYTLGKLQIQKLRRDYHTLKGKAFSLKQFHDAFLQQGYPPIKLVRQALLGQAGDSL